MRKEQHKRTGDGRYAVGTRCDACSKPTGGDNNYSSHPWTDCVDSDGKKWGDIALHLCEGCAVATAEMTTVGEFKAYVKSLKKKPKRVRKP